MDQLVRVALLSLVVELCLSAEPAAVHFIGDGYNVLKGNPDGDSWTHGGQDPGLLLARQILKIDAGDNPTQVAYQLHDACQTTKYVSLTYGPKSYQDKLLRNVQFAGTKTPNLETSAFTLSKAYSAAKHLTSLQGSSTPYVVQDEVTRCVLGTARYRHSLVEHQMFTLTDDFINAVCALPLQYDFQAYLQFVDTWGTHIVTGLDLGKQTTNRHEPFLRDYIDHLRKQVPRDVTIGGSYLGYSSSYQVDLNSLSYQPEFSTVFGPQITSLVTGSDVALEPVGLTLTTLDYALLPKFWDGHEVDSRCLSSGNNLNLTAQIAQKRGHIVGLLQGYAPMKQADRPTANPLAMPVTWPKGTYGLQKPTSGCPQKSTTWLSHGYLYQETEMQTGDNSWTSPNHFSAVLTRGSFLLRFCMKSVNDDQLFSLDWPAGDYCIYKYKTCPSGFTEGFIQWDDENTNNQNNHSGPVPDGDYGTDTKLYFCCRSDGPATTPVVLPTDQPFYLFRGSSDCQAVAGMLSSEEHLLYDLDDTNAKTSENLSPVHPGLKLCNQLHPGCGTTITMYHCFYQKSHTPGIIG